MSVALQYLCLPIYYNDYRYRSSLEGDTAFQREKIFSKLSMVIVAIPFSMFSYFITNSVLY